MVRSHFGSQCILVSYLVFVGEGLELIKSKHLAAFWLSKIMWSLHGRMTHLGTSDGRVGF